MSNLDDFSDEQLREELKRRANRPVCPHPPERHIVAHENDPNFYPRRGCLDCNTWFAPPQLKPNRGAFSP